MANLPEGLAQFEYHKMQLIGSLSHVADSMRNCAQMADTFAQMVSQFPYNHPIIPNGQFAVPAALPPPPPPMLGRGKRKAGDEADGRKSKRVKKPKDPNAPKRPASSYLLFQNEIRQELKAKNPTLPNNELLGVIAKMWKDMPKEEKDAYEARQKLAKDQWLADKTAYKASQGGAPTDPTAATTPVDADVVPKPGDVETSEEESSDEEESSSSSDEKQVKRAQKTKNKA
ncbi:high mobility group box domain-containing protein [Abortiporus biennis]|nr:high mobility group box domain-containing protein [Abortiporus biennis]